MSIITCNSGVSSAYRRNEKFITLSYTDRSGQDRLVVNNYRTMSTEFWSTVGSLITKIMSLGYEVELDYDGNNHFHLSYYKVGRKDSKSKLAKFRLNPSDWTKTMVAGYAKKSKSSNGLYILTLAVNQSESKKGIFTTYVEYCGYIEHLCSKMVADFGYHHSVAKSLTSYLV